jgi:hypothetical protein
MADEEKTKSLKMFNSVTCSKKPKKVPLNDLIFRACCREDDEIKYSLINYIQSEGKAAMLLGIDSNFFWDSLDLILSSWKNGNVYLAIDSKSVVYGYLIGDNRNPYIDIVEVICPYRGKGVGTFMVRKWEEICLEDYGKSSGLEITLKPLDGSVSFWTKMGYEFIGKYTMRKILAESI